MYTLTESPETDRTIRSLSTLDTVGAIDEGRWSFFISETPEITYDYTARRFITPDRREGRNRA